jgi:sirohydrochlorin cobaltochelatase
MNTTEAIILIGHGAVASDTPKALVTELKALEAQRRAQGLSEMSKREAELDKLIREWPRTRETDPYKWGLETLAEKLKARLRDRRLVIAYNEFCAPSLQEAIKGLVEEGIQRITLLTTMFTPGGVHSEIEIPQTLQTLRQRCPNVILEYAWPFDLEYVADFLIGHLERVNKIINGQDGGQHR